ncbi:putative tRNA (carboxymethyluridine(34)-5-O)-methyltransferase [Medicago truncatula]|uniref:2OG-Fe(II) oxygenase family oxidoreductase n=1 Tax=Medicago truncatula TaxID=3880 RepID=G7K3F0_MEDTR|nr:alkylated DNA repair protein alkB homolog 8 [Medicago truncatula]AET00428.1 2OG-Fe(II) oxygenase family oxidoreductase [Medicago truncatula]RHN57722.1 putative tRNA (carboxymethyluridine(34)-5-O)-methyltransferase [Medicago truncatula]
MSKDEDDEYEQQAILEQVFGHSSSSDSSFDSDSDNCYSKWERIEKVKGLWIVRNFLSSHKQSRLLSSIASENWFTQPSINQSMRFGYQNLPRWAIKLSDSICQSCSSSPSPFLQNLSMRYPFFDQMITNVYQPGEGICPHVDLLKFEDGIAIVSLESSCVMDFTLGDETVPVLLEPGSLVMMYGEARYVWKHEINRKDAGFQSWKGQLLDQTTRTSITLRKLCSSPPSI